MPELYWEFPGDVKKKELTPISSGLGPGPFAYQLLLHPRQGDRFRIVLSNLKEISLHLRDDPDKLSRLIRCNNWRFTIVGCSSVLLLGDYRFGEDLLEKFLEDSWIAPQLAGALGLLHAYRVTAVFEELLAEGNFRNRATNPKTIFSAYAVLRLLNPNTVLDFEGGELFHQSELGDPGNNPIFYAKVVAIEAVNQFWEFWGSNIGAIYGARENWDGENWDASSFPERP